MCAIGLGLPLDTFTEKLTGGAHLLSPTGSNLKTNDVGTIFAGFHYDYSFLTVHGKSRYPGLSLWTREWEKVSAVVPDGCLLMQSGMTFEHLSGGYIRAGLHEVVFNEKTKTSLEARQAAWNEKGLGEAQWRVSSTFFG